MKKTITIFGVSGAGMNLANKFMKQYKQGECIANVHPVIVDTSLDFEKKGWEYEFHHVAGFEGMGGERKDSSVIVKPVKQIITKIAAKMAVVIFDTAGGSGATIATTIVKQLQDDGVPVMVIAITTQDNYLETFNTENAIKSLHNITGRNDKTMLCKFINNTVKTVADSEVIETLNTITKLLSGELLELDTADMVNFIHPSNYKTIKFPRGLLGFDNKEPKSDDTSDVLAMRAVSKDESDAPVLYGLSKKVGYYTPGSELDTEFLVVYKDSVKETRTAVTERLNAYRDAIEEAEEEDFGDDGDGMCY